MCVHRRKAKKQRACQQCSDCSTSDDEWSSVINRPEEDEAFPYQTSSNTWNALIRDMNSWIWAEWDTALQLTKEYRRYIGLFVLGPLVPSSWWIDDQLLPSHFDSPKKDLRFLSKETSPASSKTGLQSILQFPLLYPSIIDPFFSQPPILLKIKRFLVLLFMMWPLWVTGKQLSTKKLRKGC